MKKLLSDKSTVNEEQKVKEMEQKETEKRYHRNLSYVIIGFLICMVFYRYHEYKELKNITLSFSTHSVLHSTTDVSENKYTIANLNAVNEKSTVTPTLAVYDLYYNVHANDFDTNASKEILKKKLTNGSICKNTIRYNKQQVEIIYHFLKGGEQISTQVSLKYLCGLE